MKKLLLLPCLFISFNLFAQIPALTGFVGGGLQFNSTDYSYTNPSVSIATTQITLTPAVGITVCNNLEVGLIAEYNSETQSHSNLNSSELLEHSFMMGPIVNYYHPLKSNSNFYCEAALSAIYGTGATYDPTISSIFPPYSEFLVEFSPGIAWHPTKHLLFKLNYGQLSYDMQTNDIEATKVNTFNFNVMPSSLLFGFDYIFYFKKTK